MIGAKRSILASIAVAMTVTILETGQLHAQSFSLPFGGGGRVSPQDAINLGLGIIGGVSRQQEAEQARRRQAEAAAREKARRKQLAKTKAGQKQLAREDAAARKRVQQQQQMNRALLNGLLGGGGGSPSNSRNYNGSGMSQDAYQFEYDRMLRQRAGTD